MEPFKNIANVPSSDQFKVKVTIDYGKKFKKKRKPTILSTICSTESTIGTESFMTHVKALY